MHCYFMFVKNDLNQFSAKPIIQNRSFILIINMLYLIRANAFLRLVCTSDGVGIGVVRALMT